MQLTAVVFTAMDIVTFSIERHLANRDLQVCKISFSDYGNWYCVLVYAGKSMVDGRRHIFNASTRATKSTNPIIRSQRMRITLKEVTIAIGWLTRWLPLDDIQMLRRLRSPGV